MLRAVRIILRDRHILQRTHQLTLPPLVGSEETLH